MSRLASRRAILLGIPAVVIAAGVAGAAWMTHIPAYLDLSRQKTTGDGHYIASVLPKQEPVSVGSLHAWVVTLTDREGGPVDGAHISIDGGMPQHGHGLPTSPAVTAKLGDGRYLGAGEFGQLQGFAQFGAVGALAAFDFGEAGGDDGAAGGSEGVDGVSLGFKAEA